MKRTRKSLFFVAGYLTFGGVMLLLAPRFTLELLLSNTDYGDVLPRVMGMCLIGIGMFVVQLIRLKMEVLYLSTIFVRLFFVGCFVWFYFLSRDPFFLVLLAIVALGVLTTAMSYRLDRRAEKP